MDDSVLTKENLRQLKALKLKQYQTPDLLTTEDEVSIRTLEAMKFSRGSIPDSVNSFSGSITPSPSEKTTSSSSSSTSDSAKSSYAQLVDDNRLWKRSYSSKKLSDYDKEMESIFDHFTAAASHTATFILFIR